MFVKELLVEPGLGYVSRTLPASHHNRKCHRLYKCYELRHDLRAKCQLHNSHHQVYRQCFHHVAVQPGYDAWRMHHNDFRR